MNNFEENNIRNNEILEKSRRLKKDEGMEHAQLKGHVLGNYTMAAVVIPILVFALLRDEIVVFNAVAAAVCAFVFGLCLTEYRFTRRKYHLAWTVFMAVSTISSIVAFVATSFGWWKDSFFWWWPL